MGAPHVRQHLLHLAVPAESNTAQSLKDINILEKEFNDRLEELTTEATKIIKDCGNACDTYSKKCLASKLFFAITWNERFTEFIGIFRKTRTRFCDVIGTISLATETKIKQQLDKVEAK